jgi:uncharacterized protein with GYD domain
MPKYLVQANYVGEGITGLLAHGGSSRRAVVEKLFASVGGTLESFYYAFGDTDLYVIADVPDNAAMASVALTVAASGALTLKTTVLLTPEEIDEAGKKSPHYQPPRK